MDKMTMKVNNAGFSGILLLFGIALKIGTPIYKYIITPVLWVLWQFAKVMPEEKADPNPSMGEKAVNAMAHGLTSVVDGVIFKTKELESEKWTREWEAKGCPAYKTND